ncbi:MAG TPA: DinB family protein [Mucilaginibacter sp.]|jgi:uncharacterized damage-inducible protein DinB
MIYSSLTERLNNQHKTISAIIIQLNNERILQRPARGKWNIHEQIAHLAKYQPVFIDRIRKILTIDEPEFGIYKAEEDSEFGLYCSFTTYELLKKISKDREEIFNLITHLPADKIERTGTHPRYGKLTVLEWTEFFLLHEAHHLYAIFKLAHSGEVKI